MLLIGIALFLAASSRGEIKEAAIAFAIGIFSGFIIDYVGVGKLHLWYYPRQPFPGMRHFAFVVLSWGVFAMTINLIWNWIDNFGIVLGALFLGQFAAYEAVNLITKSWKYYAPAWLVLIGWFPLVLSFRGLFLLFSKLG